MRIERKSTIALFVDMQEKLLPVIHEGYLVVERAVLLLRGLNALGIPTVFLRQYPKGLGDTVTPLREIALEHAPFDKLAYSAMKDVAIATKFAQLRSEGAKNILVCGVESHICVLQSCIDLKAVGFQPVLLSDCVGSRRSGEKIIALKRAEQEGVLLSTAEAILFELCVTAGTDEFKIISKLVR